MLLIAAVNKLLHRFFRLRRGVGYNEGIVDLAGRVFGDSVYRCLYSRHLTCHENDDVSAAYMVFGYEIYICGLCHSIRYKNSVCCSAYFYKSVCSC